MKKVQHNWFEVAVSGYTSWPRRDVKHLGK